jgi:site-specific recombinase XerD
MEDRSFLADSVLTNQEHKTPAERKTRQTISDLLPYYVAYAGHEWRLGSKTVRGYVHGLHRIVRVVGDVTPEELTIQAILAVKSDLVAKGAGDYWIREVINALRSFLKFCRLVLNLEVLEPKSISMPRIPRRDVVFLTPAEIEQFLSAIPLYTNKTRMDVRWLGFRSLVEVLLGTGMRISEALSVKCTDVKFDTGEARIIGKGNKERTVFFTPRALGWVKEYMNRRSDQSEWLFALPDGTHMTINTVHNRFRRIRARSGLLKIVTPHILRHTCATTLLFNGCPIGFIKEVLGHDRLETTCKYYLGVDKTAAKEAHRKYLTF